LKSIQARHADEKGDHEMTLHNQSESWQDRQPDTLLERAPQAAGKRSDGGDILTLYLQEIGQVKLLSSQEETRLARRIRRGDDQARQQMIKSNLRLVVHIACAFQGAGLPLLDLINEGNVGLMKAVSRFDPAKGSKFSTYAAYWIKQSMRRALSRQSRLIRLPSHIVKRVRQLRDTEMNLAGELGRMPNDEEVGEAAGVSGHRVLQLRAIAASPASLDAALGEDQEDSSQLKDFVQDESAADPGTRLEEMNMSALIQELLSHLTPRETVILQERFGLAGGREKTLEEVGHRFGVSRERIRQLEALALQKMRQMIVDRENCGAAWSE